MEPAARATIHAQSLAAYPREACGLLIGTRADVSLALEAPACRNTAAEPNRFELHPEDFLAAETDAAARGLTVIGVWHSHPDQPAVPSARDRVDAYAAWSHVICSVGAREVHALRSWRIIDGESMEEALLPILDRQRPEGPEGF